MSDAPKMTEREELLKLCEHHIAEDGNLDMVTLARALKECLERTPPMPTLTESDRACIESAQYHAEKNPSAWWSETFFELLGIIERLTSVPSPPETLKDAPKYDEATGKWINKIHGAG